MMNGMVPGGEGGDPACLIEPRVPSVLAGIEAILIGHAPAVAEAVGFEVWPGFCGGLAVWGVGRDSDQGDMAGKAQRLRAVPAGAVGDHRGVDMSGELGAALIAVPLPHGRVGAGQHQPHRALALRAAGAEAIGVVVTRIAGQRWPRACGGAAVSAAAFWPEAGLVLAP
jgi:hypothetical protein